jgi:hypothetical protein
MLDTLVEVNPAVPAKPPMAEVAIELEAHQTAVVTKLAITPADGMGAWSAAVPMTHSSGSP